MSGFAGVVNSDGAPVDAELLRRMAERLAFRGPDGTAVRMLDGAGFCFTLMRTGPSPQAEQQPFTLDRRQWLIGDIRLDGREDLRMLLGQAGQPTPEATATDEELALRVWQLRGAECGDVLMGDYAFAIWEPVARRLVSVRDVIGVRPRCASATHSRLCELSRAWTLAWIPISWVISCWRVGVQTRSGRCIEVSAGCRPGTCLSFRKESRPRGVFSSCL
jgi:asparagine synthetase B (glutamine-hydrolysing)